MLSSPSQSPRPEPAPVAARPAPTYRGRFVTACQQLLALAVVVAVLTPAARTVSMDVRPAAPPADGAVVADAALRSAQVPSRVPASPVEPEVIEYGLTAPTGARVAPGTLRVARRTTTAGRQELTSDPVPVVGYGTVGVTWGHGVEVDDERIAVTVRTLAHGTW